MPDRSSPISRSSEVGGVKIVTGVRRISRRKKRTTKDESIRASSNPPSTNNQEQTDKIASSAQAQAANQAELLMRPPTSFLTFWIGGDLFALPLARAREIARCDAITKVPNTPPCLRGVTNLRGTVIPVVDLAPRFDRSLTTIGARTCIVVLEVDWTGESLTMGLVVDSVGHVSAIETEIVSTSSSFSTRARADLLSSLVPFGRTFAAVLDVDRALSAQEVLEWSSGGDRFQGADSGSDSAAQSKRSHDRTDGVH
jgi:purine-binding chemotaxis protein CheW